MVYQGGEDGGGSRLYVGNLAYDVRESEVEDMFKEYGPIKAITMKKGFAFVDFDERRDAEDALRAMHNRQHAGRTLNIDWAGKTGSTNNRNGGGDTRGYGNGNRGSTAGATRNLFVANLPPEMTEEEVRRYFDEFGRVLAVKLLPQRGLGGRASFVDFDSADSAKKAHDRTHELDGFTLRTDFNTRGAPRGEPRDDRDYGRRDDRGYDRYDDRGRDDRYGDRDRYDERGRGGRYDDRDRYADERRYDRPPPRYDDDRRGGYDDRRDERGYDDRRDERPRYEERERDRDYNRPRYDDRDRSPPDDRYDRDGRGR